MNLSVNDVARLVKALTPQQRSRVVHVRHQPFDVYIGRRCREFDASPWANPFRLGDESQRRAMVRRYVEWLLDQPALLDQVSVLKGKRLGCWCRSPRHDVLCHGLVLIALAEM